MKKNKTGFGRGDFTTKLIFLCIFTAFIIIPLLRMLFNINGESVAEVTSSAQFLPAILHSFTTAGTATVIVMVMAYMLAVAFARTDVKCKGLFSVILTLPMLIPSISHGMGLVITLGNNGIITRMLGLQASVYGFWGIVIGSVMYALPVAFIMLSDILKYEDYSPYEAAEILGISPARRFASITLPYLRKPLISIVFAVFTMIVTDYGVPVVIGGKYKTLAAVMYEEVIGRQEFGNGAVYGAILLAPAIIAFVLDVINRDKGNAVFVTKPFELKKTVGARIFAYVVLAAVSVLVLLPVICFIVIGFAKRYPTDMSFTLENLEKTFDMDAGTYLFNSVFIALLTSIIGVGISFITAFLTARSKNAMAKALHLVAITAAAIPGIVLGLSYVMVFKKTFIYETFIILVIVNMVHFIASPYMMLYNSFSKLNENLEAVGKTMGVSRGRMLKDIFLPQCLPTVLEAASYFFVNCMMTISAVSFLANTDIKPVALMINQFADQQRFECAAIVSLVILIINLLMKLTVYLLKKIKY